jgi:hypothetical protein
VLICLRARGYAGFAPSRFQSTRRRAVWNTQGQVVVAGGRPFPRSKDAVAAALARNMDAAAIRWLNDNGFNGPIAKLWHLLTGHR